MCTVCIASLEDVANVMLSEINLVYKCQMNVFSMTMSVKMLYFFQCEWKAASVTMMPMSLFQYHALSIVCLREVSTVWHQALTSFMEECHVDI